MLATTLSHYLLLFLPCCQAAVTGSFAAMITEAPDLTQGALYKRSSPSICGYVSGNTANPITCASPQICQWSTSTGYIGEMLCQTNGYTASFGSYCVDYGETTPVECAGENSSLCDYCTGTEFPYCKTILYASGPIDQIQYSSVMCAGTNNNRSIYAYYEPTASLITSATGRTVYSTSSSATNYSSSASISTGAIVGIVVACVAVVAIIIVLLFLLKKRRSKSLQEKSVVQQQQQQMGSENYRNPDTLPEIIG